MGGIVVEVDTQLIPKRYTSGISPALDPDLRKQRTFGESAARADKYRTSRSVKPSTAMQALSGLSDWQPTSAAGRGEGGSADLPPIPARSPFARTSAREKSQLNAKALTPSSTRPSYQRSDTSAQPVPGSNRSQPLAKTGQRSQSSTSTGQDQAQAEISRSTTPSTVINSLNYAQHHDNSTISNAPLRKTPSRASLHRRTSRESLKSTFSAKALLKPHSGSSNVAQAAEPVMTPAMSLAALVVNSSTRKLGPQWILASGTAIHQTMHWIRL